MYGDLAPGIVRTEPNEERNRPVCLLLPSTCHLHNRLVASSMWPRKLAASRPLLEARAGKSAPSNKRTLSLVRWRTKSAIPFSPGTAWSSGEHAGTALDAVFFVDLLQICCEARPDVGRARGAPRGLIHLVGDRHTEDQASTSPSSFRPFEAPIATPHEGRPRRAVTVERSEKASHSNGSCA